MNTTTTPLKRWLLRNYKIVRPVLPNRHLPVRARGGRIYLNLHESPMMLARVLKSYEPDKFDAIAAVLRPGMTFLDIGANKGDFSLFAARLMGDRGRVLTFEPAPENVRWVERSVERNEYRSIEVLPVALGDQAGESVLHLSANSGFHTLKSPLGNHHTVGEAVVPVRRLDDVLRERDIDHVDVIKIDVEGAEMEVLNGAAETLSASGPCRILLDLHPPIVSSAEVCALLRDHGFTIKHPAPPYAEMTDVHQKVRDVIADRA